LFNKDISIGDFTKKIPFFVVSFLIACLGVYLVQKYQVFATAPYGYNLFDKICLAGFSLVFYLYNAFIPADISNYHAYPFKEGTVLGAKYILAPLVLLVILGLVYISIKRKNFNVVIGFVIFLVVIGPTLRLIPTGYPITADRYFYLASIGLFWTVIILLEKLYNISFAFKCFVIAAGLIFVCAFAVISFKRVSDWKDSFSLWNSTLKHDPWHEVANDHLGKLYDKMGNKDLALMHFERILQRDTTKYDIMNSAGNILIEKHEPALAMKYFNSAIATGMADHLPYYNRGMLYNDEGKFSLAIKDFDKAILLKPDFAEGFNNRGIAKVQSGDTLGAYADFQKAVQYKPSDQMMKDNLARVRLYLPSNKQ
jgi:tetratricopeptide (TPR) repeat protein